MTLDEYAGELKSGVSHGLSDMARAGFADIGDTYQEVLLSHSSVSAPEPLTDTYEPQQPEAEMQPESPAMDLQFC